MKYVLTLVTLSMLCFSARGQQSPCDFITDEQLLEMHIVRSGLTTRTLDIPKAVYGTKEDLPRSDCLYDMKLSTGLHPLVLLSLVTVRNREDEKVIRVSTEDLLFKVQTAAERPKPTGRSLEWPIDLGSCSESTSPQLPPMAGCWRVDKGKFLTVNLIADEAVMDDAAQYRSKATGIGTRAQKYFEAIFAKVVQE
jgi:hypothetical protein